MKYKLFTSDFWISWNDRTPSLKTVIFLILICIFATFSLQYSSLSTINTKSNDKSVKDANNPILLFEGFQSSLLINESATLFDESHISLGDGSLEESSSENISLFLDDTHGWVANSYQTNISNIEDQRNWVNNNNFGSDNDLVPLRIYQVHESAHDYSKNMDPANIISTVYGNSTFIRLHLFEYNIENNYDYLSIRDENNTELEQIDGIGTDFITRWYRAANLQLSLYSDGSYNYYGYYIDYFEVYNQTTISVNLNNWTYYHSSNPSPERFTGGINQKLNESVMWAKIDGETSDSIAYSYDAGDESGISQNLTIPRGNVIDASFSMDFYMEKGIATNDMYVYCMIDDNVVYSRGFRTIGDAGKFKWHSTGDINLALWENSSIIFNGALNQQILNFSIGIASGSSVSYSGFDDRQSQLVYFDNINLILKTEANSTQADINITLNSNSLNDDNECWGLANYSESSLWQIDPVDIEIHSNSPQLDFDLYSQLDAYHLTESKTSAEGSSGSMISISSTGQIEWNFYHKVYTPPGFENFEFQIAKPFGWNITSVEDPAGLPTNFDGGDPEDNFVCIGRDSAYFPGWWHFTANSPNLIDLNETNLWYKTSWMNFTAFTETSCAYDVGDVIKINTTVDNSQYDISNLESTWANLTIFDPSENIWYSESVHPDIFGKINYTNLTIGAINTTAGTYNYQIVWMNGTSAGGFNGSFCIQHNLQYSLLFPRDATHDLIGEGVFGDVIPVRLLLNDSENGQLVSNILISYNWTDGIHSLNEVSQGLYDTSLDSMNLPSQGLYYIQFNISKIGFYNRSFTLQLHLMMETRLLVTDFDQDMELGKNISIKVKYETIDSIGIEDAIISLNMSEKFYTVTPMVDAGNYNLIFNTSVYPYSGLNYLQINITKDNFEAQSFIQTLQIKPIQVQFEILLNNADCTLNQSYIEKINQQLNISVSTTTIFGSYPVTSGNLSLIDSEDFSKNLILVGSLFTVIFNTTDLGLGIHYLSLIFSQENYQTTGKTLQISINQLQLTPTLYNTNSTIIRSLEENFDATIYLEDPITHQPLDHAVVSYSWLFGTGLLTSLGEGYYKFSENAPSQGGSYSITIFVSNGENYQIESLSLMIIANEPEKEPISPLWYTIPIGLALAVLVGVIIKQNVIIPRREKRIEYLERKTQIFSDLNSLEGLMIIQKSSGLLLHNHVFNDSDYEKQTLFSGFLQAIMLFSAQLGSDSKKNSLAPGDLKERKSLEFNQEDFNILVMDGKHIRLAVILTTRASDSIKDMANDFVNEFEFIFGDILSNWNGNTSLFDQTSEELIIKFFKLEMKGEFSLTKSEQRSQLIRTIVKPNTVSSDVYQIIETLHKDQVNFKLNTVVSLIPAQNQLLAKDALLQMIQTKILVKPDIVEKKVKNIEQSISKLK